MHETWNVFKYLSTLTAIQEDVILAGFFAMLLIITGVILFVIISIRQGKMCVDIKKGDAEIKLGDNEQQLNISEVKK